MLHCFACKLQPIAAIVKIGKWIKCTSFTDPFRFGVVVVAVVVVQFHRKIASALFLQPYFEYHDQWSVISKNPTNLTAPIITTLLSMAMVIFAYWLTIHDDHYHHQSHSTVPIESRKAAASSVFTAVTTTTTIVIDGIINFIGNINCVHLETDRVCVRHRCCTITAWWASSFLLWERRQTWCGIHQAAYHHSKRGGR